MVLLSYPIAKNWLMVLFLASVSHIFISLLKNASIDDFSPFGRFIYAQILMCIGRLMRLFGVFQQPDILCDTDRTPARLEEYYEMSI